MRASTAYFAGAGTVIAAIAAGLGGGLLMADIISPKSPRPGAELTRLERRMSPEPIQVTATPAEPVPFVSAPPRFAAGTTVGAAVAQTEPQTETASASRAPDPGPARQAAVPEDAAAKVRDTEAKRANDRRDAEMKRAEDKRRAPAAMGRAPPPSAATTGIARGRRQGEGRRRADPAVHGRACENRDASDQAVRPGVKLGLRSRRDRNRSSGHRACGCGPVPDLNHNIHWRCGSPSGARAPPSSGGITSSSCDLRSAAFSSRPAATLGSVVVLANLRRMVA